MRAASAANNTQVTSNDTVGLGRGVYNRGFLSAVDALFSENRTEDDGGAIYITPTGSAQIESSEVTSNFAADDGGGIFNVGSLATLDSFYSGNVANNTGGGIFTAPDAFTSIEEDVFFSDNTPNDQFG